MADQTADDFSYETYRTNLLDALLDTFPCYYENESYDAHDALTEAVFEVTDQYFVGKRGQDAIAILDNSQNDPDEWQPFTEGKDDWEEVMKAMAFTVVRQDLYDTLEDEGYLDDHWNATDKLRVVGRDDEVEHITTAIMNRAGDRNVELEREARAEAREMVANDDVPEELQSESAKVGE